MKNPVTILLMTVHLLAYTNLAQVIRFPNLIHHYYTHHQQNKQIGFLDFLQMHYGNCNDQSSNENKDDMQLPFKTMDIHLAAQAIVVPLFSFNTQLPTIVYQNYVYSYYTKFIPDTPANSLFRPPIM
jgi:hypothetical protein